MILRAFMIYIYLESYLSIIYRLFFINATPFILIFIYKKIARFLKSLLVEKNLHPGFHYSFLLLLPFLYLSSNLLALTRKPSHFGVGMWNTFASLLLVHSVFRVKALQSSLRSGEGTRNNSGSNPNALPHPDEEKE